MYPVIFSFGKINIYTHGTMIALGAVLGGLLIYYLVKRENLNQKIVFDLIVLSLFAGIVGARINYIIFYYYQFPTWYEMFYIWNGGLVSFGGIIFGILTAAYFLKRNHQNILKWFDIGAIGLLLGWSLGRVGCLLSGDITGVSSAIKIAIWGQLPVALFESIWTFSLAAVLFILFVKKYFQKYGDGFIFITGLAGYFFGRFAIDFARDERILYIFKSGQITSLVMFLISVVVLYVYYIKKRPSYENHYLKNSNGGDNV